MSILFYLSLTVHVCTNLQIYLWSQKKSYQAIESYYWLSRGESLNIIGAVEAYKLHEVCRLGHLEACPPGKFEHNLGGELARVQCIILVWLPPHCCTHSYGPVYSAELVVL